MAKRVLVVTNEILADANEVPEPLRPIFDADADDLAAMGGLRCRSRPCLGRRASAYGL
jgi:hypothetical protein